MSIDLKVKVPLLVAFHEKLEEPGWTFDGNGPGEKDRILMLEFDKVCLSLFIHFVFPLCFSSCCDFAAHVHFPLRRRLCAGH